MKKRYFIASLFILVAIASLVIMGSTVTSYDTIEVMSSPIDTIGDFDVNVDSTTTISKNEDYVYLGGFPLGIDVKSIGLIIMNKQEVITDNGAVTPCKDVDIHNGDRLVAIDNTKVMSERDVTNAIQDKGKVILTIEHDGKSRDYIVNPAIDTLTHTYRLGLWLRDGVTGIGTMTYISTNMRYGALGHPIEKDRVYRGGNIYNATITGCVKGERGKAGELNGSIIAGKTIGTIDKNTDYGIFGRYLGDVSNLTKVGIAHRNEVKPGRACIYTTISGGTPRSYDIEIIKRNIQPKSDTKGMVIRIIDKELLNNTNGILQGMSGSPIIQNNKLIGAVTHVFINDPTKGFGVYSDFMIGK